MKFLLFTALLLSVRSWTSTRFLKMTNIVIESDESTKIIIPRLNWYVIGESKAIRRSKPYKTTVWDQEYVYWKTKTGKFVAMDDRCPHRGAALSAGKLTSDNNIMCPYHGYEFDKNGTLEKIPGLEFKNTPCHNLNTYSVVEKNGWLYLNTIPRVNGLDFNVSEIFMEPEAENPEFSPIFIKADFNAYARIVTENSLDIMHIGFVHTFGNRDSPSPVKESPPKPVANDPFHYQTKYDYLSGKDSLVKRVFDLPTLSIENEFILPHTTIARIKFGEFVSTVVTFATPINETSTKLYVKTYRNFWRGDDSNPFAYWIDLVGNRMTEKMMTATVNQDKCVIENIPLKYIDGKFNMKFDKLQNVYRTMYKKFILREPRFP